MFFSNCSLKRVSTVLVMAFALTGFLALPIQNAKAGSPEHLIKMNRVDYKVPIQVMRNAQVKLHNNWRISLHETTIRQIKSGSRLAQIETIIAGQTVTLEFPKTGSYSVCYSLGQDKPETESRCLLLDVIPMKTA